MNVPDFTFSQTDSFERLSAVTRSLLTDLDSHRLTADQTQTIIVELLKAEKGPRAFFATLLTSETAVADQPSAPMIAALREIPETVGDILAKNLAMSTAMEWHHRRNGETKMAQGAAQVRMRSQYLLWQLEDSTTRPRLNAMLNSLEGEGDYSAFLSRWDYDSQQRTAIQEVFENTLTHRDSPC